MPVIHETDAEYDRIGAAISRQFMDVNGKIETTRNPPDRDPYQGDGRTALGDAQVTHHCANCEATERRNAELRTALAKQDHEIGQILGRALGYPRFADDQKNFPGATDADGVCVGEHVAATLASEAARKIEALRAAVIAYVAARDREENSSAEAFTNDWFAAWEATEDAFAALKTAAGITAKCQQNEGGIC